MFRATVLAVTALITLGLVTLVPVALAPTAAATTTGVCNRYCDGRSAAHPVHDRQAVSTNDVSLHFDDLDDMGWAVGAQTVWLDRSFDAGRTWSSLGRATRRTAMYNNDDWRGHGVGLLRACTETRCTDWRRSTWNAYDRRSAAATALMENYDMSTGLWATTNWWNAANALTAIIDSGRYGYAIAHTYDLNLQAQDGNFTNNYNDDTLWWGLAWLRAYDVTGDRRYLDTARFDADHVSGYWDDVCGGGVWWNTDRTYKNAITNSLYIELNAALHNRIPKDTAYVRRATQGWSWFRNTGMINAANMVNDGLNANCANNGQPTWTYNQGVPLAALSELYKATGNRDLLAQARTMADASTVDAAINTDGILHDPGDKPGGGGADGPSFKGAYVRGLAELDTLLPGRPYRTYLNRQADSAYAHDRNGFDMYGLLWAGPLDKVDAARQQSALDLMNAAT
ncbi:MAG TPA: glycoside hydrolase family 76 protein [Kutzneria sp.]|jgi:predicted alpha-1,6-mannanase (GH76 family)